MLTGKNKQTNMNEYKKTWMNRWSCWYRLWNFIGCIKKKNNFIWCKKKQKQTWMNTKEQTNIKGGQFAVFDISNDQLSFSHNIVLDSAPVGLFHYYPSHIGIEKKKQTWMNKNKHEWMKNFRLACIKWKWRNRLCLFLC